MFITDLKLQQERLVLRQVHLEYKKLVHDVKAWGDANFFTARRTASIVKIGACYLLLRRVGRKLNFLTGETKYVPFELWVQFFRYFSGALSDWEGLVGFGT